MHPSWQSKILDYYRDLFRDTSNKQTVQMIFATHSEYVIRSAMKERNNILVVVLQNNGTDIVANKIDVPQIYSLSFITRIGLPIISACRVKSVQAISISIACNFFSLGTFPAKNFKPLGM